MKHDTDSTENKISDLKIIRYTKIEKLKHLIDDVLEWDYLHLTTECKDGSELYRALRRLEAFYNENKSNIA